MLYAKTAEYTLYHGKMQDELENLADNSVDSIVTDPPYEINFMSKGWDNSGVAFQKDTWERCLRVLKPGGYLLAFGGSRTFHRIACAIEDAGFEIRDTIMWLYGSGFPKSMNIGLAIDKKKGVESIDTGVRSPVARPNCTKSNTLYETGIVGKDFTIKKATNEWQSWGTALKPSYEPIIVARKPCEGACVDNVLKWGVGGLNIDECRVENTTEDLGRNNKVKSYGGVTIGNSRTPPLDQRGRIEGRFPANTILTYDDSDFDEVCGGLPSGGQNGSITKRYEMNNQVYGDYGKCNTWQAYNDSGSAARYFMNCKFSKRDEEVWKELYVSNAEKHSRISQATIDNIAPTNVETLLKELKDHYAKYAESLQNLCETSIARDIAEMLTWDFKIETSQVIQDFITNSKKCTQFLNLAQFVEQMDNIDTTPITQNLLKLFGYVKVVITNYIQGNVKCEQKRYLYEPKATTRDRAEGLQNFVIHTAGERTNRKEGSAGINAYAGATGQAKNMHPTVKPTALMQYLIRLVTPRGGTILDPFMGSGSTGKAAMYENRDRNADYKFIGIEMTAEYLPIAEARIAYAAGDTSEVKYAEPSAPQSTDSQVKFDL